MKHLIALFLYILFGSIYAHAESNVEATKIDLYSPANDEYIPDSIIPRMNRSDEDLSAVIMIRELIEDTPKEVKDFSYLRREINSKEKIKTSADLHTVLLMPVLMFFVCIIGFIVASIRFSIVRIKRKRQYEQLLKSRKWKQFGDSRIATSSLPSEQSTTFPAARKDSHIAMSTPLSDRENSQEKALNPPIIQKSLKRILALDLALIIAGYIIIVLFLTKDLFTATVVYTIFSVIAYSISTFVSSKLYMDVFKKFAMLFYAETFALLLYLLYLFRLGEFCFPLIKLITCGVCIYSAVKFKTEWARWIFGGLAVLYNPVFQIRLAEDNHEFEKTWLFINIIMFLFMWIALYIENKNRSKNVP